jgi:hypothetical protein
MSYPPSLHLSTILHSEGHDIREIIEIVEKCSLGEVADE